MQLLYHSSEVLPTQMQTNKGHKNVFATFGRINTILLDTFPNPLQIGRHLEITGNNAVLLEYRYLYKIK